MNIYPRHSRLGDRLWKPSATANGGKATALATESQTLNGKYSKLHQAPLASTTPPPSTLIMATNLQKTTKTIITFIAAYFEDSNIHGLQYVVKGSLTTIEKCLWLTLLIVSMFFCVMIGLQSVDRYYTKSTVVGLERDFYYWNTTMPSVTVCPLKRLDNQLFKIYSSANNLNPDETDKLFDFLEHMANATYSNLRNIPHNKSIDLLLDRLKITPSKYMELIYNLTGDISFKTKKDRAESMDRVRATAGDFTIESRQILTEYGLCYMTNTMLSYKFSSSYMIWGVMPFTDIRELPLTLRVKQSSYFDSDVSYNFLGFGNKPIDSFLHSAYEIMQVDHNLGYTLEPFQVDVEAVEIITEDGFETGATIEQRKCRFQNESNLTHFPLYTRNICLQECRLNLVYEMCKCIPHFYPNRIAQPKPVCDYNVLQECVMQHEDYFLKLYKINENGERDTLECNCVQNCEDAIVNKRSKYHMENGIDLMGGNSLLFSMINLPTYRLKRQIIFSFADLMVSIGGTAGLFLGFSVLCLVEIVYFFTFRLLFFVIKNFFSKKQIVDK